MKLSLLLSCLASQGVLAVNVASTGSHSLRASGQISPDAEQALKRVEAVEAERSSRMLCKIVGTDGGSVTVRLQPSNNARSLVFNDDVDGVETMVRCLGQPDPQCLAAPTDTVHSAEECPPCPCNENADELYGAYANAMAREVDAQYSQRHSSDDSDSHFRVLMLGLGGGELAAHVSKSCAGAEIEAVELDGRLPVLAKRYFGMPDSVKTTVGDAGPVVSALEQSVADNQLLADQRQYNSILVDCFSTGGVTPEHCRSEEFVGKLHALLRNGGRVLHHMWHVDERHPQVPTDFSNTIALYKKNFACKGCRVDVQPLPNGPDSLIIASYPAAES